MDLNHLYFLIGAFVLFFYKGVFCGYVVDDNVMYPQVQKCKEQFFAKTSTIKNRIDALNTMLYGAGLFKRSQFDHLFSLLIHLANCILIYSIVQGRVGFLTSLLYMLNPVNNQTTLWLNGRRYALSVLAVLISWKFSVATLIFYPFAVWLHVSAVTFPLLFLLVPGKKLLLVSLIGLFIGFFSGFKGLKETFKARLAQFTQPAGGNEAQKLTWRKSIIFVKSIGVFFFHCLLPFKPVMYHEFLYYFGRYKQGTEQGYSIKSIEFFKGLFALGFLGYEMFWYHSIWAAWFLMFLLQYSGVYTITMNIADRYLCIAGIGLMVLLAQMITSLPAQFGNAVLAAVLMFYVLKYLPLFSAYRNYNSFLWYHIGISPSGVEARSILALHYFNAPKPDPMSAFAVLKEGLKRRPHDFKLQLAMAQALFMVGKIEAGMKVLDMAEQNCPLGDEADCKMEFDKMRNALQHQIKLEELAAKMPKPKPPNGLNLHGKRGDLAEAAK